MVDKSQAIHWQDVENALKVYPDLDSLTQKYIMQFLGYLPVEQIWNRHRLFIRTVVGNWQAGSLTDGAFINEMESHIKNVRNDDMLVSGYSLKTQFTTEDYCRYETLLPELREAAHDRLAEFTDTDAPIEYALDAELMLRQYLSTDQRLSAETCDPMDYRAATIFYFQGNLFTEGCTAAENSLLYRLDVLRNFNVCPTDLEQTQR